MRATARSRSTSTSSRASDVVIPSPRPVGPVPAASTVLFDLDGTLTDPKEGITQSIRHALRELGRPVPPADELLWTIGPPLRLSFMQLLGSEDLADEGVRLYRERFGTIGLFENAVIPGIPDLLDRLATEGRRLFVATSKPHVFATRIIEKFGLAARFLHVYGSELDGANADKRDLLRMIVRREGLDAAATVMIGDREHDVIGARTSGIATIGVRWGYGSDEELIEAGAAVLVDRPEEIGALLAEAGPFNPARPAPGASR